PCAWHPIVIARVVGPIAGRPDVALGGKWRLLVHGHGGRGHINRDTNLREGCRRDGQHYQREQQRTNGGNDTHCASSCRFILGLPGGALLLRVEWIERHDFRTRRAAHFVSLANSSAKTFSFRNCLSLVKNAQFEKGSWPTMIAQRSWFSLLLAADG